MKVFMKSIPSISPKHKMMVAVMFGIFFSTLIACGDNKQPKSVAVKATGTKYKQATKLKGLVETKDGPALSGMVEATDASGQVVASISLQGNKRYVLQIPAGSELPLELTYTPDDSQEKGKRLKTAVIHATMHKFDINPLTTAIADKAKAMGGYTSTNMVQAAKSSVSVPKGNQTVGGFSGDPTKQYGGWH